MANQLKAQQLRTVWIKKADPLDVLIALELLRANKALTVGQSGTVAYEPIANATLMEIPAVRFDGIYWNVLIFVTTD
jgi:hypothetical protein